MNEAESQRGSESATLTEAAAANDKAVKTIGRRYYFFTLIASLFGAAIQMVLLLSEYDATLGVYQRNSPLAGFFIALVILVTLVICTLPIAIKKKSLPMPDLLPPEDTPTIFASTLCGFILIAILILQAMIGLPGAETKDLSGWFWLAVLILAVPCAIFFLLPMLPGRNKKGAETVLALSPVLWCLAYLMTVYFDNSIALHSPTRILTQLAMIASMLFFLSELRMRVGLPASPMLLTCTNISIFYSCICAVPMISVAFINQWELKPDILYSAVQLCFLTYFAAKANAIYCRRGSAAQL